MTHRKIVFLDLEDTIIDDFTKELFAAPVNLEAVKRFLSAEAAHEHRLFSFAISDAVDVATYKRCFESWLNGILGITVNTSAVFTTEELYALCQKHHLFFENERECLIFHGKDYGFQRYVEMRKDLQNMEVVLLDDAVESKTIDYPERNLRLRMVNVKDLYL